MPNLIDLLERSALVAYDLRQEVETMKRTLDTEIPAMNMIVLASMDADEAAKKLTGALLRDPYIFTGRETDT